MYIVFDIGGTNMRIAGSEDGVNLLPPVIVDTPQDFETAMKMFAETALKISGGKKILAIAGGVPGLLNGSRDTILSAPHLMGWIGKPLKASFEKFSGAPVFIENDTAMAGIGEYSAGAGRGSHVLAYMTVSTGVGGCRIVEGKIEEGNASFEPGQQIIDESSHSTLEDLVSGTALRKKFGKHPGEITDPSVWESVAKDLAVGLHNVILLWAPDTVVLGGSMVVKKVGISVPAVEKEIKDIMKAWPTLPKIVRAELGDSGGLIGSLAYLRTKFSL